jgi:Protein of unknwon function (DUF3310).
MSEEYDSINHPEQYNQYSREVIDTMEGMSTHEEFVGYLKNNVIKYLARYKFKGGKESLEKAQWYLSRLIETEYDNKS